MIITVNRAVLEQALEALERYSGVGALCGLLALVLVFAPIGGVLK